MATLVSRHVPELDGLRGIAIIAVLLHHVFPRWLTGGFLGVDLFFVLSGFLITSLLLAEFEKTETISLRNFYIRRVLRLGPALFLYLLACLAVTYHTQLITVSRQIKLIVIALLYSTNLRLAFGWDSVMDPTAIIWSLSIEEQFYLVWPQVLFVCLAFKLRRRFIIAGLCLTIIAILLHRNVLFNAQAQWARLYYGTDTRADALLMGCLTALVPVTIVRLRTKPWFQAASVFSLAALAYLMITSKPSDAFLFRSGFTAVALLASAVIFVAANSPPRILSVALQWSLLRWFGRISYGLYLWHWLVVSYPGLDYLVYSEPVVELAIALGIASASYYLVEKPFNRLKNRFAILPGPPASRA